MNTLIITNNNNIFEQIKGHMTLLRETDVFYCSDYENAYEKIYEIRPNIIMLHENDNKEDTLNLVHNIREKNIYSNTQILLLLNNYDKSFVLSAYDNGINDYVLVNADISEILIRTVNCIKNYDLLKKNQTLIGNLTHYGLIESKTLFYSAKYEKDILDSEMHMTDYNNGCYVILSPNTFSNKEFPSELLPLAIKNSIRMGDFVANISGAKYSILIKTHIEGCINLLQRIKQHLPDEYRLHAGIAVIDTKNFEDIKKKAVCALNNALLKELDYSVYSSDENNAEDWLNDTETEEKTYKLFKNAFTKKIENIISPIFYRAQKTYEEKLDGAKIEQYTDERQSVFRIINEKNESRITMRYPGYSKLIIYISHAGLDSPDNREIILPMNQITESKIDEILESFINEFIGIYRHLHEDNN